MKSRREAEIILKVTLAWPRLLTPDDIHRIKDCTAQYFNDLNGPAYDHTRFADEQLIDRIRNDVREVEMINLRADRVVA